MKKCRDLTFSQNTYFVLFFALIISNGCGRRSETNLSTQSVTGDTGYNSLYFKTDYPSLTPTPDFDASNANMDQASDRLASFPSTEQPVLERRFLPESGIADVLSYLRKHEGESDKVFEELFRERWIRKEGWAGIVDCRPRKVVKYEFLECWFVRIKAPNSSDFVWIESKDDLSDLREGLPVAFRGWLIHYGEIPDNEDAKSMFGAELFEIQRADGKFLAFKNVEISRETN